MGENLTREVVGSVIFSLCVLLSSGLRVDDDLLPSGNGTLCQRFICDLPGVLLAAQEAKLANLTMDTAKASVCESCSCGGAPGLQIGIGIVAHRNYSTTNGTARMLEDYAFGRRVLNAWNLSLCGNDILLLVVSEQYKMITTFGEVAKRNIPDQCAQEVSSMVETFVSKGRFYDALENSIWSIRTVYRNPNDPNLPVCFGKVTEHGMSPTVIVLIVLSILVVFGIIAFIIWHVSGQKKLRYLNYNPNNHVRFNNYAGMTDFGTANDPTPPSTVTGEFAMWQGSVSEGTFDNPGYEERRGSLRAC